MEKINQKAINVKKNYAQEFNYSLKKLFFYYFVSRFSHFILFLHTFKEVDFHKKYIKRLLDDIVHLLTLNHNLYSVKTNIIQGGK